MQFNSYHNIGQKIFTVEFLTPRSFEFWASFSDSLKRIGGESQKTLKTWHFPIFVSSRIISEIIHNTCFKCGGLMKDSTAFQNTNVSFDDFGNDAGSRGTTQSRVGQAQQIKVRKCSSCGHSHT